MSKSINPVLWLELRLRLRERKLWVISLVFLLILLAVTSAAVGMRQNRNAVPREGIATALLWGDYVTLLGLILLISGLAGAGRISQEREQRTLAGLLNTPLTSAEIVGGKLLGAWAFVGWFLLLSLPFVGTMLFWGAAWQQVALGFAVCAAAGLTVSALAIGFSGVFRNSLTSYLATGFFLFFWLVVLPAIGGVSHLASLAHPGEAPTSSLAQYVFFDPNPFVALYGVLKESQEPASLATGFLVAAVWAGLALIGFGLGVAGLRRGIFAQS